MKILNRFPEILKHIPTSVRMVDITDVARWFHKERAYDNFDLKQDLPCKVSPFDDAWFEWDVPKAVLETTGIAPIKTQFRRIGGYTSQLKLDPSMGETYVREHFIEYAIENVTGSKITRSAHSIADIMRDCQESGEWPVFLTTITIIVATVQDHISPGIILYYSDRYGRTLGDLRNAFSINEVGNFAPLVYPMFFALNLMHSKNVKKSSEQGKARTYKVAGKNRTVRYSHVHIDGFSHMSDGRIGEGGWHTAQHYRRGHFKTYTDMSPLMGRHVGTYWFAPTIVGAKEHGVVESDYTVEVPEV